VMQAGKLFGAADWLPALFVVFFHTK